MTGDERRTVLVLASAVAVLLVALIGGVALATRPDGPPVDLAPGDRLIQVGRDWVLTRCTGTAAVITGRVGGEPYAEFEPYDTVCADRRDTEKEPEK